MCRPVPSVEPLETRQLFSGIPFHTFPLPSGTNFPSNLTVGADGNVWFTCGLASKMGYIRPNGSTTIFDTSKISTHGLDGLTLGRDGNLWAVEFWDNRVARITPQGGITVYKLPTTYGPQHIAAGPDGNFWITTFDGYVGRFTPAGQVNWFDHRGGDTGKIVSFAGSLYFAESHGIGRIGTSGAFTGEFKLPDGGNLKDITVGPDGNLWFVENSLKSTDPSDFVGYLTPAGKFREFAVPKAGNDLTDIVAGGDGNLYFRRSFNDNLFGITPSGKLFATQHIEFIAGDGSMVESPNGNVWFAEGVLDKIGVAYVPGGAVAGTVQRTLSSRSHQPLAGVTVWADVDRNGVFDPRDVSAVTDKSGHYTLNLPVGTYTIHFVAPKGLHAVGTAAFNETVVVGKTITGVNFFAS